MPDENCWICGVPFKNEEPKVLFGARSDGQHHTRYAHIDCLLKRSQAERLDR